MTHVQQPRRSRLCGQTCVAIVADVSLERAQAACTEGYQRATSEHDLRRGFKRLGFTLGAFTRNRHPLPGYAGTAVARVRYASLPHTYHWIAFQGDVVFDPALPHPVNGVAYVARLVRRAAHITSWAPVDPRLPLMSFALTTAQVRNQTKTVTRRLGWKDAKAGDVAQPIVKGQGLKKGERVQRINGPIRFVSVDREWLYQIENHDGDCAKEGFPEMTPADFVEMFCRHNGCRNGDQVTRIEFEYVKEA